MSDNNKPSNSPVETNQDEAFDSLGIVVGGIAHDFNNILSLIFGYVEMALGEIPPGDRAYSDLEHVLAAGDRAKELVSRILTFSNQSRLKRHAINLYRPIGPALEAFSKKLPSSISLQSQINCTDGVIEGNEVELFQIVTNLCNNSLQALTETGSAIQVSLERATKEDLNINEALVQSAVNYIVLSVKDDGCGMDLSTQEKMYTPFFTTQRNSSDHKAHAGLGLTTVEHMVTSMGGFIFVDSTLGKGTTFKVFLPETTQAPNQLADSDTFNSLSKLPHILFVDDEPAITEMAHDILTQSGYSITLYNDGNEALTHFKKSPHEFDLIITDLVMPVLSGSELAEQCRAINPKIPIILTTGFSQKISSNSSNQWGVSLVINKPFLIQELLEEIEKLLDDSSS